MDPCFIHSQHKLVRICPKKGSCASDQRSELWVTNGLRFFFFYIQIIRKNAMNSFLRKTKSTSYECLCNLSVTHNYAIDFSDFFDSHNSDKPSRTGIILKALSVPRFKSTIHFFTVAYELTSFPSVASVSALTV